VYVPQVSKPLSRETPAQFGASSDTAPRLIALKSVCRDAMRRYRAIQPYLGHRNIQRAESYNQLAAGRFKDIWKD
jgi:hypothetical protein